MSDAITREECLERSTRILDSTERIEDALFGKDRRGGISNDLSKVVMRLTRIEDTLKKNHKSEVQVKNISVKRLAIITTTISTVLVALINAAMTYWMAM